MNTFKLVVTVFLITLLAACGGNGIKSINGAATQEQTTEAREGRWVQKNIFPPKNYGEERWIEIHKKKGQYLVLKVEHPNEALVFMTGTTQERDLYRGVDGFVGEEVVLLRLHQDYATITKQQGPERIYYCVVDVAADAADCSTEDVEEPEWLASL